MATVKLKGTPCETNGELPKVGSTAPDFKLVDKDLADKTLADYAGKKKLISISPSLDTSTCAVSTKKFNELVAGRHDVVLLYVSADLPFAMSRFCSAEKLSNVITLSMMRSRNFAKDYGVLLTSGPLAGLTTRAIVVLDQNNKVLYTELVSEIPNEPNYDAAIKALK